MMTGARRLLQNAAAMLVLAVLQRGMGLVATFLLARILDVQGLGAYTFTQATSQTFFGLVRLGADAGLHVSVANFQLPDDKEQAGKLLGEALVLFVSITAVAAGALILLAHPIAATLFAAPQLSPFVTASAVLLAAQVVSQYCYTVFAGLHSFVVYARVTWATSLLTLVLAVLGAVLFGAVGAIWGGAVGGTLAAVTLFIWLLRELARRGVALRPRLPSQCTVALLALGFPFYVSGMLLIPADFLCVGYLGRVEGVGALGELRVVQSLMSAATVLPAALSGPLISHLASRLSGNGGADAVLVQLRAIWVLSLAIAVGLATLWPVLVGMIFGADFAVATSAGVLALLGFTPMMLGSVLTGAFLASRRSSMLLVIGMIQVLSIAIAARPLIAGFGLGGYLAVQAVYSSIGAIASLILLGRQFREPFVRPWMLPMAALTIAISVLIVGDVALGASLGTRFVVGAGIMMLLLLTCAAFVFTPMELRLIWTSIMAALGRAEMSGGHASAAAESE